MSASPYLTEEEIERLTRPLVQQAAIVKRLRAMGFTVKVAPDGSPIISRANHDLVMGGIQARPAANDAPAGPDEAALLRFPADRVKSARGQTAKR
jgi:hypothetical protein